MILRINILVMMVSSVLICPGFTQTDIVTIPFEQLRDFVRQQSPEMKLVIGQYDLTKIERKIDLQWSNPEIAFEHEKVKSDWDEEKEYAVTLEKSFSMPWVKALHRSSWNEQLKAAELKKESEFLQVLATIKSGYVRIKLYESQTQRLKNFERVVETASGIARDRLAEGAISGLEQQLIHMSMFNLKSHILKIGQDRRELLSEWKTSLGIEEGQGIQLVTPFEFKPFNTGKVDDYIAMFTTSIEYKRREYLQKAMKKRIQMAQASLLSEMRVFGGYKQVNTDYKGFVLGLSLPLPLLNKNGSQIQKEQIELTLLNAESDIYKKRVLGLLDAKLQTIEEYTSFFAENEQQLKAVDTVVENLTFSYREGWITLGDLLDGIQIYSESIESYYEQLSNYYSTIFQLEVLVAQDLLSL